jgi:hypothetical protein
LSNGEVELINGRFDVYHSAVAMEENKKNPASNCQRDLGNQKITGTALSRYKLRRRALLKKYRANIIINMIQAPMNWRSFSPDSRP